MVTRRCAVAALWATMLSTTAFAAQTDITISMDKPPATPRLNGATVVAAIPGSPFLHTISATGQAPLTFAAAGCVLLWLSYLPGRATGKADP